MDLYLFNQINQFVGKWQLLNILGVFFAQYLEYVLIFCLILIVLFKKRYRMFFQAIIAGILSRFVIAEIIYFFWYRPRPFINNVVNLLVGHADTSSFPSGHASFYFALASAIFFRNKKLGSFFLLGAVLISISRVFTGVHWPSDIFAGAIIGIFSGWLIYKFSDKKI